MNKNHTLDYIRENLFVFAPPPFSETDFRKQNGKYQMIINVTIQSKYNLQHLQNLIIKFEVNKK